MDQEENIPKFVLEKFNNLKENLPIFNNNLTTTNSNNQEDSQNSQTVTASENVDVTDGNATDGKMNGIINSTTKNHSTDISNTINNNNNEPKKKN